MRLHILAVGLSPLMLEKMTVAANDSGMDCLIESTGFSDFSIESPGGDRADCIFLGLSGNGQDLCDWLEQAHDLRLLPKRSPMIIVPESGGCRLALEMAIRYDLDIAPDEMISAQCLELYIRRAISSAEKERHRQSLETALIRREANLKAITESTVDGILILDKSGDVTFANKAAERAFGCRTGQLAGLSIVQLIDIDQSGLNIATTDGLIQGWGIKQDQERFRLELTISSFLSGQDNFTTIIFRDITQTHEALENDIQQSKMETLGRLTGGIAHDFNNILGVICGNAELLNRRLQCDKPEEDLLLRIKHILDAAGRGAVLTQRLMAFCRKKAVSPVTIDVNDLLSGLTDMLVYIVEDDIELKIEPGQLDQWQIHADSQQVENAIINLVANARDAIRESDVAHPQISVVTGYKYLEAGNSEGCAPGPYVRVSVRDNGCGMSLEAARKAIEPFYTTKEIGKGTGLGLSMTYQSLKDAGGTLVIESQENKGTTIHLYYPAVSRTQTQQSKEDNAGLNAETDPGGEISHGGETIMLVEDNGSLREAVRLQLEDMGYAVFEADQAHKALEVLEKIGGADLLLTDVMMPGGMSGFELANQVQDIYPNMKMAFTTGYVQDMAEQEALLPLEGEILYKPYTDSELARYVRRMIDS